MSSTQLEEAQEEAKSDMTPMIDCVFLMIIFFICIDFKVLEAKLPAYLPKDKGSQSFEVKPQEQLSIGIWVQNPGQKEWPHSDGPGINKDTKRPHRFVLRGHTVRWMVGPTPAHDIDELKRALDAIYNNKSTWQPDKDDPSKLVPMPVVIEPHPGTYYADVAMTADAVKAANFDEINFGGGLGAGGAGGTSGGSGGQK